MEHRIKIIESFENHDNLKSKIIENLNEEVRKYNEKAETIKHNAENTREIDVEDTLQLKNRFTNCIEGISNFNLIGDNLIRITLYSDVQEEGFTPFRRRYHPHKTLFEIPRCMKTTCFLCIKENKGVLFLPVRYNKKIDTLVNRLFIDVLCIQNYREVKLNDRSFSDIKNKIELLEDFNPRLDSLSILADINGDARRVGHFNLSIPYERQMYQQITQNNPFNFLKIRFSLSIPTEDDNFGVYIILKNKSDDVVDTSFPEKNFKNINNVYNLLADLFLD